MAASQEWVALVACLQSPTERTKPGVWQKALSGLAQLRFPLPGVEEKDARFVLTLFTPANLQDDPRPAAHYCKFVTNILYHQDNVGLLCSPWGGESGRFPGIQGPCHHGCSVSVDDWWAGCALTTHVEGLQNRIGASKPHCSSVL